MVLGNLSDIGGIPLLLIQEINIKQRRAHIQKYRLRFYHSAREVNLANLSICPCKEGVEVTFFYDERRSGMPFRYGHNKDYNNLQSPFYRRDCLNETAFILEENQYGRILWNERKTDCDTGEWYYWLHIYNIISSPDEIPQKNIFVENEPDFVYRQMELL